MTDHSPTPPAPGEIHVTGHSDDLVELDGLIREEWMHYGPGPARVEFDNGVALDIEFDRDRDGIWRIGVVSGAYYVRVITCPDPSGEDVYTDTAIVTGARAATFGEHTATATPQRHA